jgi:hypothetical protein
MTTAHIAPQPHVDGWGWRLLRWTPRILAILFIAFLSLFSLDVFGAGYSPWETVVAFAMHNIPSLVLLVFVILAWRWQWVGSIGFLVLLAWYWNMNGWKVAGDWIGLLAFGFIPALIALLYLADSLAQRRRSG